MAAWQQSRGDVNRTAREAGAVTRATGAPVSNDPPVAAAQRASVSLNPRKTPRAVSTAIDEKVDGHLELSGPANPLHHARSRLHNANRVQAGTP